MNGRFRVGLVGAGPWASNVHAPTIADHPAFQLTGVWARRPDAAAKLAGRHGAESFDDVGALIDAVDVVAFAVPPAVQGELAASAASAGRAVILDKPIAETLDAAEELAEAVASAGVASVVMLTLRYAAETRAWLDAVGGEAGWSGGNARWLSGALLGGEYAGSGWRQEHGGILDIGPHLFDLVDAALGAIVDVRAVARSEHDVWHVLFEHQSGATSAVSLSMQLPLEPSVVDFDVYGSAGRRALTARQTPAGDCYATMLDELASMIATGTTEHPCDVRRGVHVQAIIDRVRRLGG